MSTSEGQNVRCFGGKVREARLRWFGHVQRWDCEYIEEYIEKDAEVETTRQET